MMTERQAESILLGAALLESIGNLYHYTGTDGHYLYFQNINTNETMKTTYDQMIVECTIQY